MKRLFIAVVALTLCSCAILKRPGRYAGWEYVRIEYAVPSEACEYRVQEACGLPDAHCYNWYKKRATRFQANTVVITQTDKNVNSSGQAIVFQGSGGANTQTATYLIALADYYHCPAEQTR